MCNWQMTQCTHFSYIFAEFWQMHNLEPPNLLSRYRHYHQPRKFLHAVFLRNPFPLTQGDRCPHFFHHTIDLPVVELHVNSITQWVHSWVGLLLLSIKLRFIHVVCSFLWLSNIPLDQTPVCLSILPSMDTRMVSSCWLLEMRCSVHFCANWHNFMSKTEYY